MFDLFVALFGGSYYFGKVMSGKKEQKQSKKQEANWEAWVSSVTDQELEKKLTSFIKDPQNWNNVFEEVKEVYLELPSCKNISDIEIREDMLRFNEPPDFLALRILMARKGKITRLDVNGICLPWGPMDAHLQSFRIRFEELMIWMDRELREHGVTIPLMFDANNVPGRECWEHVFIPVDEVPISPYRFYGRYTWRYDIR